MELSEEGKKIIDRINRSYDDNTQYVEASAEDWNCIVHLMRKQQNKIDAQEMEHQYDQKMIDDLKGEMVHNWIHKDKIREKMKEIIGYAFTTSEERHCQNYAYDRLKELLEELNK